MTTSPSTLVNLAETFDQLILARDKNLSSAAQGSLVAAFVRNYLSGLLATKEIELENILSENLQLHAQARIFEERGIDPAEALQRRIRQGGLFGSLLQRFASHLGALDCLLDLRATAALVHHLIRLQPHEDLPQKVLGCEFGAGTAVLSVAAAIPMLAAGRTLTIHAFEQSAATLQEASPLIDQLKSKSRFGDRLTIHLHQADVTLDSPYRQVAAAVAESGPLALWLSETFGHRTKKPVLDIAANSCSFAAPSGIAPYSGDQEKHYDPLPEVLSHSCRHFPGFLNGIADGTILAFPDLVTPRCILDGTSSTLLGADGVWRKLHRLGEPYTMLPPCVPSRWYLGERQAASKGKKRVGLKGKTPPG
jgi:hypothetical protein